MSRTILAAVLLLSVLCHGAHAARKVPNIYSVVESDPRFTIVKLALDVTGLAEGLKDPNFKGTAFFPTNKALLSLLAKLNIPVGSSSGDPAFIANLFKYHITKAVISSKSIPRFPKSASATSLLGKPISAFATSKIVVVRGYYSNARVVEADITAPKAYAHIISSVLLPPGLENFPGCQSVVGAAKASKLTLLVKALEVTGLAPIFASKQFKGTVIAPTNAAISALLRKLKIPVSQLPRLSPKQKQLLKKVLTYHVVGPRVISSNMLRNNRKLKTLNNQALTAIVDGKGFGFKGFASTGRVLAADILTCRAVIHVVNAVLLPKL